MVLKSLHSINKIVEILTEEVDERPSLLKCLFNPVIYYVGLSSVCGKVNSTGFELRNRRENFFSLIANGKFIESKTGNGTFIDVDFKMPVFSRDIYRMLTNGYKNDEETILAFLIKSLDAKQIN